MAPLFFLSYFVFTLKLSKYKTVVVVVVVVVMSNDVVYNSTLLEEVLLSKRVMFDFICFHVLDRHVRTMTLHNKIA
jgi:hypothetical protein